MIAGATLDPERLLWEPRKKLISIPSPADEAMIQAYVELCLNQAVIEFQRQWNALLMGQYETIVYAPGRTLFPRVLPVDSLPMLHG